VNHPLFDGHERTAWLSCVTFLSVNDVHLAPDIDAAERLVVGVATGEVGEVPEIAKHLRALREER
jgi:death-on-curing protein